MGTEIHPIPPTIDKKLYVYDSPETIPRPPPPLTPENPQEQRQQSRPFNTSGIIHYNPQRPQNYNSPAGSYQQSSRPTQNSQQKPRSGPSTSSSQPLNQPQQTHYQNTSSPTQNHQNRRPPRFINQGQQGRSNGFNGHEGGSSVRAM